MSISNTPATLLDAINVLLGSIGEAPVNQAENPGILDAVVAKATLHEVNRAVQARGWHFNTRRRVRLLPHAFPPHHITLPDNTLSVDTVDEDRALDVVLHGNRLFDVRANSYDFQHPVHVELVLLHPFENLPEQARHYITVRAARIFQSRTVGSQELAALALEDEAAAHAALRRMENRRADYNALTDNPFARKIRSRRPWR